MKDELHVPAGYDLITIPHEDGSFTVTIKKRRK